MSQKVLFLCGNAQQELNTTEQLGQFLLQACLELHMSTARFKFSAEDSFESQWPDVLAEIQNADIIILAFSLSFDCQPAPVIRLMEEMYLQRVKIGMKKIMIMIDCVFPEANQNDTAIAICHAFAEDMNFKWLGALSMGEENVINGRTLTQHPKLTQPVMTALLLTAEALAQGRTIPWEAQKSMSKPLIPIKLYQHMSSWNCKHIAKKNRVAKRIFDRPYVFDKKDLF